MLGEKARIFSRKRKTYKDVLTPSQSVEMSKFLTTLSVGYEECKQAGVKPDVSAAITAWGHIPMTEEEMAITTGFRYREKLEKERV